jgi:hypothetical protein
MTEEREKEENFLEGRKKIENPPNKYADGFDFCFFLSVLYNKSVRNEMGKKLFASVSALLLSCTHDNRKQG